MLILLYETVCLYKISLKRRNCSLSNLKDFSFIISFINEVQHNICIDNPNSYILL